MAKKKIDEILTLCAAKYPEHSFVVDPLNMDVIMTPIEVVPEIFKWLRDDPELRFDYFDFSTCTDHPPVTMDLIYYVFSNEHKHRLGLKVRLARENPIIGTVANLWRNADWNEREIYDLFGVFFTGHPDQRRLMMPDDWEGHPLRKDYMHPNVVTRPD